MRCYFDKVSKTVSESLTLTRHHGKQSDSRTTKRRKGDSEGFVVVSDWAGSAALSVRARKECVCFLGYAVVHVQGIVSVGTVWNCIARERSERVRVAAGTSDTVRIIVSPTLVRRDIVQCAQFDTVRVNDNIRILRACCSVFGIRSRTCSARDRHCSSRT